MGWLITLGILILIGFIRVGVLVRYDADGALLRLILGPVKLTLVPAKKGTKKEKGKDKKKISGKDDKKTAKAAAETKELPTDPPPAAKPKKSFGGPIADFIPLVKVVLAFVGEFFARLRFRDLYLKLILAGDDPCDLAMNYGRAWEALGDLAPALDNALNIKKRDLEIECDFCAEQTLVKAGAEITITIGRLLYLLVRYGYRALKEFIKMKKKRKGGAKS